jgi:hypothetical protein
MLWLGTGEQIEKHLAAEWMKLQEYANVGREMKIVLLFHRFNTNSREPSLCGT